MKTRKTETARPLATTVSKAKQAKFDRLAARQKRTRADLLRIVVEDFLSRPEGNA